MSEYELCSIENIIRSYFSYLKIIVYKGGLILPWTTDEKPVNKLHFYYPTIDKPFDI